MPDPEFDLWLHEMFGTSEEERLQVFVIGQGASFTPPGPQMHRRLDHVRTVLEHAARVYSDALSGTSFQVSHVLQALVEETFRRHESDGLRAEYETRFGHFAKAAHAYLMILRGQKELVVLPWSGSWRPLVAPVDTTQHFLPKSTVYLSGHYQTEPLADVQPVLQRLGWAPRWHELIGGQPDTREESEVEALAALDAALNQIRDNQQDLASHFAKHSAALRQHEANAESLLDRIDFQFTGRGNERSRHDH